MSSRGKRDEQTSNGSELKEAIFDERDICDDGNGVSCRLCVEAEKVLRTRQIQRLTLLVNKVVDLSGLDIVLVPGVDDVTEIICCGGVIARRLHATNIKVNGPLIAPDGFVSTDPEGWLAVEGDMICRRVFGKDIAVAGTLSAEALAAENMVVEKLYVRRLLGGINLLIVRAEPYFDGEFWTRGAYVVTTTDDVLQQTNVQSRERFRERLTAGTLLNSRAVPEWFDRCQLAKSSDLTLVNAEKIAALQTELQRSLGAVYRELG
jgi:hypothetical protein